MLLISYFMNGTVLSSPYKYIKKRNTATTSFSKYFQVDEHEFFCFFLASIR